MDVSEAPTLNERGSDIGGTRRRAPFVIFIHAFFPLELSLGQLATDELQ